MVIIWIIRCKYGGDNDDDSVTETTMKVKDTENNIGRDDVVDGDDDDDVDDDVSETTNEREGYGR